MKKLKIEISLDEKKLLGPNLLEKLLGWLTIIVFVSQIIYKINSGQLIFIFNPCHVVGLIEAFLLLKYNSPNVRIVYIVLMNTLFSPWIAIAFPVTTGLDGPFERPMFWVEHYLVGIINPLVLSLTHRYYTNNTICFLNHIFAHVIFGVYQRTVLFPISQMTHANLNFTLCGSNTDPFLIYVDTWYYFLSEFYIFMFGEIFNRMIGKVLEVIKYFERLIFHKGNSEKDITEDLYNKEN